MSPRAKSSAREAFEANIADAEVLLSYAMAFSNNRKRRMRPELQERVGEALRVSARNRSKMDCLASETVFLVFKDARKMGPDDFSDLRPLLRPTIVAACAALETFVADRVMDFVGPALGSEDPPRRLRDVKLSIGRWIEIETKYERRKWGIRTVIEENVRELSSTNPNKVGAVLGFIGFENWAARVDKRRGVKSGATVEQLRQLTERRNLIAHTADRRGLGRASLEISDVVEYIKQIRAIVEALDSEISKHKIR